MRGFEDEGKNIHTNPSTCAPETLKMDISKIKQKRYDVKTLDVKIHERKTLSKLSKTL